METLSRGTPVCLTQLVEHTGIYTCGCYVQVYGRGAEVGGGFDQKTQNSREFDKFRTYKFSSWPSTGSYGGDGEAFSPAALYCREKASLRDPEIVKLSGFLMSTDGMGRKKRGKRRAEGVSWFCRRGRGEGVER